MTLCRYVYTSACDHSLGASDSTLVNAATDAVYRVDTICCVTIALPLVGPGVINGIFALYCV